VDEYPVKDGEARFHLKDLTDGNHVPVPRESDSSTDTSGSFPVPDVMKNMRESEFAMRVMPEIGAARCVETTSSSVMWLVYHDVESGTLTAQFANDADSVYNFGKKFEIRGIDNTPDLPGQHERTSDIIPALGDYGSLINENGVIIALGFGLNNCTEKPRWVGTASWKAVKDNDEPETCRMLPEIVTKTWASPWLSKFAAGKPKPKVPKNLTNATNSSLALNVPTNEYYSAQTMNAVHPSNPIQELVMEMEQAKSAALNKTNATNATNAPTAAQTMSATNPSEHTESAVSVKTNVDQIDQNNATNAMKSTVAKRMTAAERMTAAHTLEMAMEMEQAKSAALIKTNAFRSRTLLSSSSFLNEISEIRDDVDGDKTNNEWYSNNETAFYWFGNSGPRDLVSHFSSTDVPGGTTRINLEKKRTTLIRFFQEVLGMDATQLFEITKSEYGLHLPWKNWFITSPDVMLSLAKLHTLLYSWIDATYPVKKVGCSPEYFNVPGNLFWSSMMGTPYRCWGYIGEYATIMYLTSSTELVQIACDHIDPFHQTHSHNLTERINIAWDQLNA
jgi:hypothetical protein